MKKMIVLLLVLLVGCTNVKVEDTYNENDTRDFKSYSVAKKFEIVNFNNVLENRVIKEGNLDGNAFLFIASVQNKYSEKIKMENYYYGYVKNQYGAIYFAEIPTNKVRIYEDSEEGKAYLVGADYESYILPEDENNWDNYEYFNLHVPKGTIIQKANIDILTKVE